MIKCKFEPLKPAKKILSFSLKLAVGLLSFWVIYWRLKNDLGPEQWPLLKTTFLSPSSLLLLLSALCLMPLNWGIESLKWQHITKPIEPIPFTDAQGSVYSGVFAGNLAPGRATEFLAKILFFKPENRISVTVLHFINGMFQLSITIILGLLAMYYKTQAFTGDLAWVKYAGSIGGLMLLLLFGWCFLNTGYILKFVIRRILKQEDATPFNYSFSRNSIIFLFGFSVVRYVVFASQMALLLICSGASFSVVLFVNTAIYFFITTTIPMVSFLEAAIRVAIALVVFKDLGIAVSLLALVSVLLWLINIVIPSIIGYIVLINKKIDFSVLKKRRKAI